MKELGLYDELVKMAEPPQDSENTGLLGFRLYASFPIHDSVQIQVRISENPINEMGIIGSQEI